MEDPLWYKFPYRTNFELGVFFTWFISGILIMSAPFFYDDLPRVTYLYLGFVNLIYSFITGREGFEIWIRKRRIRGYPLTFINPKSDYVLDRMQLFDKEIRENVKKNGKD